jgi:hypothetical protein
MNKVLTILLLILAPPAFACPNLTGTYFCKSKYENIPDYYVTISQTQFENHWRFTQIFKNVKKQTPDTYEYITDGVARPMTDQDSGYKFTMSSVCEGNVLKHKGIIDTGGLGDIQFSIENRLEQDGSFIRHLKTSGNVDDTTICPRSILK